MVTSHIQTQGPRKAQGHGCASPSPAFAFAFAFAFAIYPVFEVALLTSGKQMDKVEAPGEWPSTGRRLQTRSRQPG